MYHKDADVIRIVDMGDLSVYMFDHGSVPGDSH